MEAALASRHRRDTASLQSVVDDLTTNQGGVNGGRAVVLKLEEQTRLGGSRRGHRFGGCQGIEDKGSVRKFGGQRGRGKGQERG